MFFGSYRSSDLAAPKAFVTVHTTEVTLAQKSQQNVFDKTAPSR